MSPIEREVEEPSTTPSSGVDLAFRPDIEGLRAIAVVLVVLYHAGVPFLGGGFVGVDVFFVISGFLITGLLLREQATRNTISIHNFYARRARRILPAGMTVIALTVIAAHHYQNFVTYGLSAQDGRWAALFAANFHFAIVGTNYFSQGQAPSPLLHYWSLAVEEQFYLIWPAVILLVGATFRRWQTRWTVGLAATAISSISFIWAIIETHSDLIWAYYSPLTRAWELGIGALAATLVHHASKLAPRVGIAIATAGLIAIATSAFIYNDATPFPGIPALLPVLGATAVIIGGASGIGAAQLLGLRPIRAVGRVSYGWYLLHYPPMILLAGALWRQPLSVEERLVIALITLFLAFVMYAGLEKPIRQSKVLATRPWMSIAMGLSFVAAAYLVGALLHKSF